MRIHTAEYELSTPPDVLTVLLDSAEVVRVLELPYDPTKPPKLREVVPGKVRLDLVELTPNQCAVAGIGAISACIQLRRELKGDHDVSFRTYRLGGKVYHTCHLTARTD